MIKIILKGGLFDGEAIYSENPANKISVEREGSVSHPYFDSEIKSSVRLDYIFYRAGPDCLHYRYHDPDVYCYEDHKSNEVADMGINVEYAGFCFSAEEPPR